MLRTRCSCGCEHIIESDKPELFTRTRVCCKRHVMFRVSETPPIKEQPKTKADQPKKRGHPKKK